MRLLSFEAFADVHDVITPLEPGPALDELRRQYSMLEAAKFFSYGPLPKDQYLLCAHARWFIVTTSARIEQYLPPSTVDPWTGQILRRNQLLSYANHLTARLGQP